MLDFLQALECDLVIILVLLYHQSHVVDSLQALEGDLATYMGIVMVGMHATAEELAEAGHEEAPLISKRQVSPLSHIYNNRQVCSFDSYIVIDNS